MCLSRHHSAEQKSSVVEEALHFGCFSPRGSPCPSPQFVATSVLVSEDRGEMLTSELQESCGDSSIVLPTELSSLEDLAMISTPSVGSGGVLAPNSEALFAKEICGLLACLKATSPGYGKAIACVLAGNASEDLIRKVEKSLKTVTIRGNRRKRGIAKKSLTEA